MKRFRWALSATLLAAAPLAVADDQERDPGQLFEKLDSDGDGVVERSEVSDEQTRLFERVLRAGDRNDDGKLTRDEFAAAMRESGDRERPMPGRGGPDGERPEFGPEQLFERFDANKDGKLTREELPEPARERMSGLFERTGKDALTREDLRGMGRPPEGGRPGGAEFLARLREMDKNKDGKLTVEEAPEEARDRIRQMIERSGQDALDLNRMATFMQRDGDRPGPGPRDGDRPRPEFREGDRPRPEGERDGDRPGPGPRDGDRPPPREGDRPGPRDGERGPGEGFGPVFLRVLDNDRDGALNLDEVRAAPSKFEELDRNKDGKLDRAELFGFPGGGPGMREGFRGPPEGRGFDRRPAPGEGRPGPDREGFRPPREGADRPDADRDDDREERRAPRGEDRDDDREDRDDDREEKERDRD